MRTRAERSAQDAQQRAAKKARDAATAEELRKAGIGESSGPASEVRNLKDDPAARAQVEETLQRLKQRSPRRAALRWPG